MKYKKVLKPKKTINDDLGEWEVVEEKRDAYLIEKPVYTDSEDEVSDSESDWLILIVNLQQFNLFKVNESI